MRKFISQRIAAYALLAILTSMAIFHVLVMTGIVPFEIVWGGRLNDPSQMLYYETVSIAINLIMLAVVAHTNGFDKMESESAGSSRHFLVDDRTLPAEHGRKYSFE